MIELDAPPSVSATLVHRRAGRPAPLNDIIDSIPFSARLFTVASLFVLAFAIASAELDGVLYLGHALQCPWQLPAATDGYLVMASHVGMVIGAVAWGMLADAMGRHPSLVIASCVLSFLLILSAFSPDLGWTIFLRGVIGSAVAGVLVISAAEMVEDFSSRFRAKVVNGALVLACVAASLLLLLWFVVQPRLGWSAVILLSALPLVLLVPGLVWLPASPRFLLLTGQPMAAMAAIQQLIGSRGSPLTSRRLADSLTCSRANLRLLFHRHLRRVSLLLLLIWFASSFAGHGGVRLALVLPWLPHNCLLGQPRRWDDAGAADSSCCTPADAATYAGAVPRSLGPLLALLLNFAMLDGIGRRWTMTVWAGVGAAALLFLSLCLPPGLRHVLIFFLSGAVSAFTAAVTLFTAEIFPTCVRTSALGVFQAVGSLGVLLSGVVEQEFLPASGTVAILAAFAVSFVVALVAAFFLRTETSNMALEQALDGNMQRSSLPPLPDDYRTFELQEVKQQ